MFFLQLRNELWKLFGKKRTYIGFGMFLVAQNIFLLIYHFHQRRMIDLLEGNGLDPHQFITATTVSTFIVVGMAFTMVPLYAALMGGDMVAKEAEDGSLRMILSRPVSRFRLLVLKWLAGAIFSFLLVTSLGAFAYLFSSFWFPQGNLFVGPPLTFSTFDTNEGLSRYATSQLFMFPKACTVMTLAFMFSCFNMKPASATILALSVIFTSMIMETLPFFSDFKGWLITYYMDFWLQMFQARIPWWKIGESLSALAGYNLTFLVIGFTAFQMRDIKS